MSIVVDGCTKLVYLLMLLIMIASNCLLFVEAVGQFGPRFKPPSQYQLREPLLKEEVNRMKELLKKSGHKMGVLLWQMLVQTEKGAS